MTNPLIKHYEKLLLRHLDPDELDYLQDNQINGLQGIGYFLTLTYLQNITLGNARKYIAVALENSMKGATSVQAGENLSRLIDRIDLMIEHSSEDTTYREFYEAHIRGALDYVGDKKDF